MFIVTKEIDAENIGKVCRTCLREDGEKMVCVFSGPAGSSLAAKLRTLSCLEVRQGDGLPEKLCDRCVTRAESALLYREQCRAADLALRQAASKVSRVASEACARVFEIHRRRRHEYAAAESALGVVERARPEAARYARYHGEPDVGFQGRALHGSPRGDAFPGGTTRRAPGRSSTDPRVDPASGRDDEGSVVAEEPTVRSLEDGNYSRRTDDFGNLTFGGSDERPPAGQRTTAATATTGEAINYSARVAAEGGSAGRIVTSEKTSRAVANSRERDAPSEPSNDSCGGDRAPGYSGSEEAEIGEESANETPKEPPSIGETGRRDSKKSHRCNVCSESFGQKSKLVSHSVVHTGEKPFACTLCEKAYASRSKLNAHYRMHAQTNVHRCEKCDKSFPYASGLAEHSRIHEESRKNRDRGENYECAVCRKRYRALKNLKIHLRLHTGKGLVRCEICQKPFGKRYNLKVHLRTHGLSPRGYRECGYCGKTMGTRASYVEHLRTHTRIKPFECRICDKRFSQSSHLKSHEASHDPSRPHRCPLCGKSYKLAAHLRRHANSHANLKPHKCDRCEQRFSRAFSLKRHSRRHASEA